MGLGQNPKHTCPTLISPTTLPRLTFSHHVNILLGRFPGTRLLESRLILIVKPSTCVRLDSVQKSDVPIV